MAGAGLIAGTMNALVGGGTFVTLPALIGAGVPSVQANTSSTVALYPSQIVAAFSYRDGQTSVAGVSLKALLVTTFCGGAVGALLLLHTSSATFDKALPWLLALATLTLMFGRRWGEALRRRVAIGPRAVLALQALLGVYGGYFGGAVGIMMMAVWGLLHNADLKSMNAPRTLLVTAANTVAVAIFIFARAVYWREALCLMAGALAGSYAGAEIGKRAPNHIVRIVTLCVSTFITLAFFVKAYFR
ncbi:MAG TPA: sulfite exporter TauE/SafE family protein [Steroidobacteraceae bacterium]